jgi:hypothetical protein
MHSNKTTNLVVVSNLVVAPTWFFRDGLGPSRKNNQKYSTFMDLRITKSMWMRGILYTYMILFYCRKENTQRDGTAMS